MYLILSSAWLHIQNLSISLYVGMFWMLLFLVCFLLLFFISFHFFSLHAHICIFIVSLLNHVTMVMLLGIADTAKMTYVHDDYIRLYFWLINLFYNYMSIYKNRVDKWVRFNKPFKLHILNNLPLRGWYHKLHS